MSEILFINGKVRFPITIDPTVWIFDDRKVDLTTYFDETRENTSELETYLKTLQNIGIAKSVMVPLFLNTTKCEEI